MLAAEGFDVGGRVDVGDGDHAGLAALYGVDRDAHLFQLAPADIELIPGGHVGHRAACCEVWQHDFLMRRAEDVGALRHEVHAAEHDELGLALARRRARELQRVAGEIGELDHLVALIVMAENHEPLAERVLGRRNARVHLVVRETQVGLRQRLALADTRLLDLVQKLDVHGSVVSRQSAVVNRSLQSES